MKPQASEGGRGYHATDLGYIKNQGGWWCRMQKQLFNIETVQLPRNSPKIQSNDFCQPGGKFFWPLSFVQNFNFDFLKPPTCQSFETITIIIFSSIIIIIFYLRWIIVISDRKFLHLIQSKRYFHSAIKQGRHLSKSKLLLHLCFRSVLYWYNTIKGLFFIYNRALKTQRI